MVMPLGNISEIKGHVDDDATPGKLDRFFCWLLVEQKIRTRTGSIDLVSNGLISRLTNQSEWSVAVYPSYCSPISSSCPQRYLLVEDLHLLSIVVLNKENVSDGCLGYAIHP